MDDNKPICQVLWFTQVLRSHLDMLNILHEARRIESDAEVHFGNLVDAIPDPFGLHYDFAQRVYLHMTYPDQFTDELPVF